ncbi:MAG: polyphenol oxidase family protein [Deltaproteobacteria bacterium]|jgi:polyphenol oxidase
MHGQGLKKESPSPPQFKPSSESLHQPNDTIQFRLRDDNPPVLQYPLLSNYSDLFHGVFTRKGGVSTPPYDQLNTSYSVGDLPRAVTTNLCTLQRAVGARYLVYMNQCHGNAAFLLDEQHLQEDWNPPAVDAMITHLTHVAVLVKQADCQAVILFDPEKRVVANVHCGWRGNVKNILGRVVHTMRRAYGTSPDRLIAAIGPSLGPCCAEFVDHQELFPEKFKKFKVKENHFDLWALSCSQLVGAGLLKEHITCARICTRCRTDLFYSYRGEGTTGRFGTIVMLTATA